MDRRRQTRKPTDRELIASGPPGGGSVPPAGAPSPSNDDKRGSPCVLPQNNSSSSSLVRRGTGPRTLAGKARSSQNALKSGIFSKAAVLKHESRAEFNSFLRSLMEDFQPEGSMERLLVEQLTTLAWRRRRLVQAETAEIEALAESQSTSALTFEDKLREIQRRRAGGSTNTESPNARLPAYDTIPRVRRAIELLGQLRDKVEARGCRGEEDSPALQELYGYNPLESPPSPLFEIYTAVSRGSEIDKIYLNDQEVRRLVIGFFNSRIQDLEDCQRLVKESRHSTLIKESRQHSRIAQEKRALLGLPPQRLDSLVRYEAHLDRLFDRTLNQLERRQRMRLGQPVLPPLEVKVSS